MKVPKEHRNILPKYEGKNIKLNPSINNDQHSIQSNPPKNNKNIGFT
jgi:hypothetical protein